MSNSVTIEIADLEMHSAIPMSGFGNILDSSKTFQEFKDQTESAFIKKQLELHDWNVSKTAEALEIERSHLYTKIKKYGLERKE